ncbi:hypothetical protein INT48_008343, partial [Thamnidium elegans]
MSNLVKEPYEDLNTNEINQLIDTYFINTTTNSWKVIDLIKHIAGQVSISDLDKFKDNLNADFGRYFSTYLPRNNASLKKMEDLKSRFSNIIKSDAATLVITESKNRNKKAMYNSVLANEVLDDKTNHIMQSANSTDIGESSSRKRPQPPLTRSKEKKGFKLTSQDFHGLNSEDAMKLFVLTYGYNNKLNLATPNLIPQRLAPILERAMKQLTLSLPMAVTLIERNVILGLRNAKTTDQLNTLINSLPFNNTSMLFLRLAMTKLSVIWSTNLLQIDHRESWFRGNVYADVFDAVFMFDGHIYETKRAECHASVIKALKRMKMLDKTEKDVKVDLLCYTKKYGDIFSCEDKAGDAQNDSVEEDVEKGIRLRENTLLYWRNILPIPSEITNIESISAQFFGLSLTIYGSRMLSDGKIIHYKKCTASIPAAFDPDLSQAAHFLLVVLSLRRTLLLNYKKLKALANICEADSIQFLTSNSTDVQYRPDSQDSESNSNESERSDDDSVNDNNESESNEPGWEERERLRRLNETITKVKKMRFEED